ncbi:MAG: hypothetical protein LBJ46_04355 [Planctomycetota bacterium]|nr:hypothetical protein [Planctomycetota bacterium]
MDAYRASARCIDTESAGYDQRFGGFLQNSVNLPLNICRLYRPSNEVGSGKFSFRHEPLHSRHRNSLLHID